MNRIFLSIIIITLINALFYCCIFLSAPNVQSDVCRSTADFYIHFLQWRVESKEIFGDKLLSSLEKKKFNECKNRLVYTEAYWPAKVSVHILFLSYRNKFRSTLVHKRQKQSKVKTVENQKWPEVNTTYWLFSSFLALPKCCSPFKLVRISPEQWVLKSRLKWLCPLGTSALLPRNTDTIPVSCKKDKLVSHTTRVR